MECSSAYVDSSLFTVYVHVLPGCRLGQHTSMSLGSQHGGTTPYTLTETKSTHIETALWNLTGQLSLCFSPLLSDAWVEAHLQFQTHTQAYSYTITHAKLCVLAGHKDWGLYTCSWHRHISLSPLLILFHLPWKEWGRERQQMRVGETKKKSISSVRCVGVFVSASSARVSSLTHSHRRGSINVCKALLVFDLT